MLRAEPGGKVGPRVSKFRIIHAEVLDGLRMLPDASVNCCVTSPPYWGLRDYGVVGQLGLERTPEEYVAAMVSVFREVRRVLRADGTCWINLGDSYAAGGQPSNRNGIGKSGLKNDGRSEDSRLHSNGLIKTKGMILPQVETGLKPKDLCGIPWRVAFALQADGWYLRSDIIWAKPNPMPESVTDRPTKAHEYLFLLTKSERYAYDAAAIAEAALQPVGEPRLCGQIKSTAFAHGGTLGTHQGASTRNKRSVWSVTSEPYAEAHFAVMPTQLVEPCVMAGCPEGGTVLDPFAGSGTVGVVALRHARDFIGIELNAEYVEMARRRIQEDMPMFNTEAETVCNIE